MREPEQPAERRVDVFCEKRFVEEISRAFAAGAADFLYKPFFAKDIDAAFSRLLGLTHLRWN